jgi:hypothetical protein
LTSSTAITGATRDIDGGSTPLSRDQVRTTFGQVMGSPALTLGRLALGAYIGRDLSGGIGNPVLRPRSAASATCKGSPRNCGSATSDPSRLLGS